MARNKKEEFVKEEGCGLEPMPRMVEGETNALEVLKFVSKTIHRSNRLNMFRFVSMVMGRKKHGETPKETPRCGTVACVAGWIGLVTRGYEDVNEYEALRYLGLDPNYGRRGASEALFKLFFDFASTKKEIHKKLNGIIREYRYELEQSKVEVR